MIMEVRHSCENDVNDIMNMIHQAQSYFKSQHIDQWQDGYPMATNILEDIHKNNSYVLVNEKVIGTMYFAFEEDPCYGVIDGKWRTQDQAYAVIHRIVVDENYKGKSLAKILLDFAIKQCQQHAIKSIRIDTHADNTSMQRFLIKNGFEACGGITLLSGAPRIGFEKIIE